jgi:hypothetical protein
LLLILYFLPLGLSIKGKALIVLAGLVLALAGLGALTTFSLLLTGLMLVVLVFFTAYMMDSKIGALLYIENFSEDLDPEIEMPDKDAQLLKTNQLPDIGRTDVVLPSIENMSTDSNSKTVLELANYTQEKGPFADLLDEDILVLMD